MPVTDDELGRVRLELELLRDEVAMLRRQLAGEIRTRRLVVVDERGFSRVVIDTLPHSGTITVRGRRHHGSDPLEVSLVAAEESDQPFAGMYVRQGDNTIVEANAVGKTPGHPLGEEATAYLILGHEGRSSISLRSFQTEAEVALHAFEPEGAGHDEQARVSLHVEQGWTEGDHTEPPHAHVIVDPPIVTASLSGIADVIAASGIGSDVAKELARRLDGGEPA